MSLQANSTIDYAANLLQSLPPLERALLGREQLIMCRTLGATVGPNEHRLMNLLSLTGRAGVILISLLLLLKRVWEQRHIPDRHELPHAFFIGIGALREKDHRSCIKHDHIFIDQRQMARFTLISRLTLCAALREWWQLVPLALKSRDDIEKEFGTLQLYSTITMRLPDLAHLLSEFRKLYAENPKAVIACSNHDMPAHAACIIGFNVEFYQHGFLSRSSVFPEFTKMHALTKKEGQHVASKVTGLLVECLSLDFTNHVQTGVLGIVGIRGFLDMTPVSALVAVALEQGWQVVVRPHPFGESLLWRDLSKLEGVLIDRDGNIDDFLSKWQPAFLATWFSTTLLDGLVAGAIPITLSAGRPNIVFPFDEISLAWPADRTLMERCMVDEAYRHATHRGFSEVVG